MMKLLTNRWMSLPIGVLMYLGTMLMVWKTPAPPKPVAAAEEPKAELVGPSWEFSNPEADQLMVELKKEKESLDARKQQLDDLGSRLQSESNELATTSITLKRMQDDIDKSMVRVKDEELPNLKRLAKIYADMAPDSAETIMSQFDDAGMVKIMLFMKENENAAILEALTKKGPAEAKRAASISEYIQHSTAHKAPTK